MNSNNHIAIILGLAVFTLFSAAYTVSEVEQVIITQFGKPIGSAIKTPGLHWHLPFIQKVHRFDKRWLEWDGEAEEMPTKEKTYIWVDTFARWRIIDPLKFFTSVVDENGAQSRLDDIIDSETRNVIAAHNLIEVVRSTNREFAKATDLDVLQEKSQSKGFGKIEQGRTKLTQMILKKAAVAMPDYGVELVDVQFQRVSYTDSVKKKVFERMISERNRIAERYRSEGEGQSAKILGMKQKELQKIESVAYKKVQGIKGVADAKATNIYAAAHNQDPQLYKLLKSLESYKKTLDKKSTLILSTESDYLKPLTSMMP